MGIRIGDWDSDDGIQGPDKYAENLGNQVKEFGQSLERTFWANTDIDDQAETFDREIKNYGKSLEPKPPSVNDPRIIAAKENETRRARGRASTLLGGYNAGGLNSGSGVARRTLIGV